MNFRHTRLGCIAVLFTALSAQAAEPVMVLGLPLGGKLQSSLRACQGNESTSKVMCWLDTPMPIGNGTHLGRVHLPNTDSLPMWAGYSTLDLTVTKGRVLEKISVTTTDTDARHEIVKSISSRFGPPHTNNLQNKGQVSANWSKPELDIQVLCSGKCWISFTSADAAARDAKEVADRKKRDAARPAMP